MPRPVTTPKHRAPDKIGIYVEVPRELLARFMELYPARGGKTQIVTAALQAAIDIKETENAARD